MGQNQRYTAMGSTRSEGEFYHTVEVICMMLFYDMIHKVDSKCPSIGENYADSANRKSRQKGDGLVTVAMIPIRMEVKE